MSSYQDATACRFESQNIWSQLMMQVSKKTYANKDVQ